MNRTSTLRVLTILCAGSLVACSASGGDDSGSTTTHVGIPTVGTSGSPPESSSAPTTSPDADPSALPIDEALHQGLGYSVSEINRAFELHRLDQVRDCLDAAGWSLDPLTLRYYEPEHALGDERFLSNYFVRVLISDDEVELSPLWDNPAFVQSYGTCATDIDSTLTNPALDISKRLESAYTDISTRAQADPEWLSAKNTYDECLSKLGLSAERIGTQNDQIIAQAEAIALEVEAGTVDSAAATNQLNELEATHTQFQATTSPCQGGVDAAELAAVGEAQQEYLRQNPGFVESIAEGMSESVHALDSYLSEL